MEEAHKKRFPLFNTEEGDVVRLCLKNLNPSSSLIINQSEAKRLMNRDAMYSYRCCRPDQTLLALSCMWHS